MKLEMWPIERFRAYENNPRKNDKAVGRMVEAIREFGFRIPIIARSDGEVVDGHLRLKAALEMGLGEAPVLLADDLSEAQVRAFRLLVNKSVGWAEWDNDLLIMELNELRGMDYDIKKTGFGEKELEKLLRPIGDGVGGERKEDCKQEIKTKLGDLWKLGNHRILCGDSTERGDVERVLGGERPMICVTDPPYGVSYEPEWRNERKRPLKSGVRVERNISTGKALNDDRADWRGAWELFPGDVIYSWAPSKNLLLNHIEGLEKSGFLLRSLIIWDKNRLVLNRGQYHHQFEPCIYAARTGGKARWRGGKDQSTVWNILNTSKGHETGHSMQKPIDCMRIPVENHTEEGDWVYEPFSGSGTTLMACELIGRRCLAIELNPAYVDMAVKRWEEHTGLKGELDGQD